MLYVKSIATAPQGSLATFTQKTFKYSESDAVEEKTAEFVFSEFKWKNGVAVSNATKDDIIITFSKGGASSNSAYYDDGTAIRMYPKSTFKVVGGTITKIEFTYAQNKSTKGICSLSANIGSIDETAWTGGVATWTGSGEPTFTVVSTNNGGLRVSKLVVYYE